jgi:CheY-like chemotaxis protein
MNKNKQNVSELLRRVDKVIKTGTLDEAAAIIDSILEISPKNIYARAYLERIEELRKERDSAAAPAPAPAPAASPVPPAPSPAAVTTPVFPSKSEQKLSDAVIEAYKTLLNEIWKDGDIAPLEHERLQSMREFFAISQDEHDYLEQNARLTSYVNAVRDEWNKGVRDFSAIKRTYRITEQESNVLQHKIDRLIKSIGAKGVILSLDDDKNFLLLTERLLEKNGYHSLNTTSGEEALNLLENFTPDLVLCDIAFGHQNMNGFMFYEKFRAIERFASIPFIFISALNQKELIKTGKRLGVDDYLTKPVDNDVLLAAVEGRIRRVREMKNAVDY